MLYQEAANDEFEECFPLKFVRSVTWAEVSSDIISKAEGLPADSSVNHKTRRQAYDQA
jgi:PIN domain nuclease of toxin-antitoxin system